VFTPSHPITAPSLLLSRLVAAALGKVKFDTELIEIMADAKREYYADAFSYTEAIQKCLRGQLEALERQEVKLFEDSSAGILSAEFYAKQMKDLQNKRVLFKKKLSELKAQSGMSTLEPNKNAFIQGNTAQSRFLNAQPEQQKIIASEVLWNLLVKEGKTEEARYKSFYQVLTKASKTSDLATMLAEQV